MTTTDDVRDGTRNGNEDPAKCRLCGRYATQKCVSCGERVCWKCLVFVSLIGDFCAGCVKGEPK